MPKRKSILTRETIRTKWVLYKALRHVERKLKRLWWWGSLYGLRFSWAKFFDESASVTFMLCMAILSFWLISHFIFESVQVIGPSMYPTLINSNFYWINKLAYELHEPRRGDIVALKDPSGMGFDVKRVIAVPGQSIYISHGKVYVNGTMLREPYLPVKIDTFAYDLKHEDEFWCLAPGQFFVMGDNRGNSCDSRSFGPIQRNAIFGEVIQ